MMGLVLECVAGSTCVALFAYAATLEDEPAILWGALSLATWLVGWLALGGGLVVLLLGQGVLYGAMAVVLAWKARRRGGSRIHRG